jgi:hypothetical protein
MTAAPAKDTPATERARGSTQHAAQANTEASLREHVDRCEAETGDLVAWLAVDFVDIGDTMAVVDELNARRAD